MAESSRGKLVLFFFVCFYFFQTASATLKTRHNPVTLRGLRAAGVKLQRFRGLPVFHVYIYSIYLYICIYICVCVLSLVCGDFAGVGNSRAELNVSFFLDRRLVNSRKVDLKG